MADIVTAERPLNFMDLSPHEFEQLVLNLAAQMGHDVAHYGGSGDRGRDVVATKEGRRTAIQCKRVATFTLREAAAEIDKLTFLKPHLRPEGVIFAIAGTVTPRTRDDVHSYCEGKFSCTFWTRPEINALLSRFPEVRTKYFDASRNWRQMAKWGAILTMLLVLILGYFLVKAYELGVTNDISVEKAEKLSKSLLDELRRDNSIDAIKNVEQLADEVRSRRLKRDESEIRRLQDVIERNMGLIRSENLTPVQVARVMAVKATLASADSSYRRVIQELSHESVRALMQQDSEYSDRVNRLLMEAHVQLTLDRNSSLSANEAHIEAATACFESIVEKSSGDELFLNIGRMRIADQFIQQNSYDQATAILNEIRQMSFSQSTVRSRTAISAAELWRFSTQRLARIASKQGDFDLAIERYTEIVELFRGNLATISLPARVTLSRNLAETLLDRAPLYQTKSLFREAAGDFWECLNLLNIDDIQPSERAMRDRVYCVAGIVNATLRFDSVLGLDPIVEELFVITDRYGLDKITDGKLASTLKIPLPLLHHLRAQIDAMRGDQLKAIASWAQAEAMLKEAELDEVVQAVVKTREGYRFPKPAAVEQGLIRSRWNTTYTNPGIGDPIAAEVTIFGDRGEYHTEQLVGTLGNVIFMESADGRVTMFGDWRAAGRRGWLVVEIASDRQSFYGRWGDLFSSTAHGEWSGTRAENQTALARPGNNT